MRNRERRSTYLIYLAVIILGLFGGMAFGYVQKMLPVMRMRYEGTRGARRGAGQDAIDDTASTARGRQAASAGRRGGGSRGAGGDASMGFVDNVIYKLYEDVKDIKDSWGKYTENSLELERDRMMREKLR
ncbi:MAG: hypothetical protein WCI77_00595 [Candidatus Omnitrophota bacterium]